MSASPALTAVTTPLASTVATLMFDDCHVAWLVTACTVPFDIAAMASNDAVAPITGAVPLTETDRTVGVEFVGAAGADEPLPPQQTASTAIATQTRKTPPSMPL